MAGKTGTATNPGADEPNSWFVAFGPNPNPQYVVLAVIDQGGYGAEAAAPLVRNIFDYLVTNPVAGTAEDAHRHQPALGRPAGQQPALRDAHDHHHCPGCDDHDRSGCHGNHHHDDDHAPRGVAVP